MEEQIFKKLKIHSGNDKINMNEIGKTAEESEEEDQIHKLAENVILQAENERKEIESRLKGPSLKKYGQDDVFFVYKQNKFYESQIVLEKKQQRFLQKLKLIKKMQQLQRIWKKEEDQERILR